jgi:hypothetical protein
MVSSLPSVFEFEFCGVESEVSSTETCSCDLSRTSSSLRGGDEELAEDEGRLVLEDELEEPL